ncbi:hypothetical protein KKD03_00605, partial [Patescibacteria group bacterium]|nr:hypothetical protein [Patescibacteria group bacterium]
RCTNLNGIVLSKPFEKSYIITDEQVKKFLSTFKYLADSGTDSNVDLETKNEALVEIINKAINNENLLKFVDGNNDQRTVSPEIILVGDTNNKQLKAHCFTTNKIEIFDLSEITDLKELSGIS